VAAFVARLTGVAGVHAHHCPPSFFRFGFQDRAELSPARVVDTSIESGLGAAPVGQELSGVLGVGLHLGPLGHVLHRQGFHHQQVELFDQLPRDLGDFTTGNYTPFDSQNTAIEVNEAALEESWL
jgi:hypothetical protein